MSFMNPLDSRSWAGRARSPERMDAKDVSVVVPVKDNPLGIERLLYAAKRMRPGATPGELIVVDNNSSPALELPSVAIADMPFPVRLLRCARPGPAAARNVGARAAAGEWLLFTDSDCLPAADLIAAYVRCAMDGALGYAGRVVCGDQDCFSRYYDSQGIFLPPAVDTIDGLARPQSLITANCLVWRTAFDDVGGFDECFPEAAGEDVDLGLRLWELGLLGFAPDAVVGHEITEGFAGFRRRFLRYGRGNARLEARHHEYDGRPRPFPAAAPTRINQALARLQYRYLLQGYLEQTVGTWSDGYSKETRARDTGTLVTE